MDLLRVEDLKKRFGGLTAVDSISFTVEDGEIVGLIGPNGAGKSTTFNLVMGALPADEGTIEYDGERIDELSTDARVRRGLGRTYQTPKQFQEFSVRENVRACMLPNRFRGTGGDKSYADRAEEVLERVALADRATASPGKLTPGELRRLEIGKALATDPELLLLDEVFAGITTAEAQELADLIATLRSEGLTFLVVDHVMEVLMPLVDRSIVLDFGQKIAEGSPEEVVRDERVREVYLGETEVA